MNDMDNLKIMCDLVRASSDRGIFTLNIENWLNGKYWSVMTIKNEHFLLYNETSTFSIKIKNFLLIIFTEIPINHVNRIISVI